MWIILQRNNDLKKVAKIYPCSLELAATFILRGEASSARQMQVSFGPYGKTPPLQTLFFGIPLRAQFKFIDISIFWDEAKL